MINCNGCYIDVFHKNDNERARCDRRYNCERLYLQGKSDMLDKIIQAEKNKYYCVEDLCDESKNCSDCMVKYLEQLKKQNIKF